MNDDDETTLKRCHLHSFETRKRERIPATSGKKYRIERIQREQNNYTLPRDHEAAFKYNPASVDAESGFHLCLRPPSPRSQSCNAVHRASSIQQIIRI